ncbi:glyoxalase superfamily protein [Paenibacillus tarimensis]
MVTAKGVIPILRIFDESKAKEFYLDFLGAKLDWEHRFESGMPLYMQISLGDCPIHLSEHYGDCIPGSAVRIEVEHIEALHKELIDKKYKYSRPGIETTPWNSREVKVTDPFGNRIILYEFLNEPG